MIIGLISYQVWVNKFKVLLPGYCGSSPKMNEAERGLPKARKGWGYCQKQCAPYFLKNEASQTVLQEVKLEVLKLADCRKFGASMKVMPNIELCAAKQVGSTKLMQTCKLQAIVITIYLLQIV